MKKVLYQAGHVPREYAHLHQIAYVNYGTTIVFSGLHNASEGMVCSTINSAERVMEAILSVEGRSFNYYRWFDLLTHLGYLRYPSGFYRYAELLPVRTQSRRGFVVTDWDNDVILPEYVRQDFSNEIGPPDPHVKIWAPEEAESSGYLPTNHHSNCNGYWVDEINIADEERRALESASDVTKLMIQSLLHKTPRYCILVDHAGKPAYLAISEGERYCVWSRSTLNNN